MLEQVKESVDFLRKKGIDNPKVGIVLGTGLGAMVNEIEMECEVAYKDIPNFPEATVEFHEGRLIFGTLNGVKVLAMQGRYHFYEGYSMQQITLPIRVMKLLGIEYLLLSNASGSMNRNIPKGNLMLLDDHINLLPLNPIIGKNEDDWGTRFPDMSAPYDHALNNKLQEIAKDKNIPLHKGVYVSVPGPNLETRAEYRYLRTIGADAVGMSTVPEVIVANHMGLPCAAVSVVTDDCDPDNLKEINIEDIIAIAGKTEPLLITLYTKLIKTLK
ncbi:MAG: purine-nucleoside phosphorylase [Bacteroidia bacterium]|nr:purine-nucleoside phosphorylase [Bacteroidia bacterium]NNC84597.1 purine-nucleoside phosphorylase [Bacteroidia bacterium]NNM16043.1 purine-nucleoside phosphorylase [Bacteroidia bacterium]